MDTIPVISLWQPWASLVAFGEKRIETRSWPWRGDLPVCLGIHAAKKWNTELNEMTFNSGPFRTVLERHGIQDKISMPFGALICVVRLVECISTNVLPVIGDGIVKVPCLARKYLEAFANERSFGDYSVGRYAWSLDKLLLLSKPIPMTGHQGIWKWEPTKEISDWCQAAMEGIP